MDLYPGSVNIQPFGKGTENFQYIASLLATGRLQGKNGFEELEKVLRQELCLS
ncbi:MAG: hypothetical protein M8353_05835 [ANME-2 cluster archaeon]|nr:hypothetical protein [ANME-2 cluster archaeon]